MISNPHTQVKNWTWRRNRTVVATIFKSLFRRQHLLQPAAVPTNKLRSNDAHNNTGNELISIGAASRPTLANCA